jgi:hypothetical protein
MVVVMLSVIQDVMTVSPATVVAILSVTQDAMTVSLATVIVIIFMAAVLIVKVGVLPATETVMEVVTVVTAVIVAILPALLLILLVVVVVIPARFVCRSRTVPQVVIATHKAVALVVVMEVVTTMVV